MTGFWCFKKIKVRKMPYKTIGRKVYHKRKGRWAVKQVASTPAKAKATVRLLYGIEGGWKPTGKKGLASADSETRRRVARMGGRARRR